MSSQKYGRWIVEGRQEPRSTKWSRKRRLLETRRKESSQLLNENGTVNRNTLEDDDIIFDPDLEPVVPDSMVDNFLFVRGGNDSSSSFLSTDDDPVVKPKRKVKRRKKRKLREVEEDVSDSSGTVGSILSSPKSSNDQCEPLSPLSSSNECNAAISDEEATQPTGDGLSNEFTCTVPDDKQTETLCPCTDMSVGDIVFSVLSLGVRHKLSWDAQVDILRLFNLIFKTANIPTNKYSYLKILNGTKVPATFQIFCSFCQFYVGEKKVVEKSPECSNCKKSIDVNSTKSSFITMSVASQLQSFLKDGKFVDNILNHRFQKPENPSHSYNDIYDGAVYKSLSKEGGILSNKLNFSYTFFVDGMAFGNSSDKTVWPIYLTINELPYEERSKYLVLAALYIGAKDPNLQTYLQPFVKEANELATNGVQWTYNSQNVSSKVIPLCCVADSVARCKLMNYQTFSAQYGCTFCYKRSQGVPGHGQRYIFDRSAVPPLRTDAELRKDLLGVAARVHMTKDEDRACRGVKGYSPLSSLRYFSMSKGFVVDYMHCILLGVTKTHMELLLENPRKRMWERMAEERIGKEHLIATIDKRISSIKSCSSVIRELRPISSMAKWRASEYRIWLVFFCFPCLKGLLKDHYLSHLGLLSKACYILMQKSLSDDHVSQVQTLLMHYTDYFQKYFKDENMLYNVHLLSHVVQGVINFGPVVGHNSFVYEAENRYLRDMCKSPSSVLLQVARKFTIYRNLPLLCSEIVRCKDTILFSNEILHYKRLKNCFKPFDGCTLLGKGTWCLMSNDERNSIAMYSDVASNTRCYQRMILKGSMYCTATYCENFQNNDSCALTVAGKVVIIKHILEFPSDIAVVVELLHVEKKPCVGNKYSSLDHVKIVKMSGIIECLSVRGISTPCILMASQNKYMYSVIPYACTVE